MSKEPEMNEEPTAHMYVLQEELHCLAASGLLARRDGRAIALLLQAEDIPPVNGSNIDGVAIEVSAASARQLAAHLLNLAEEIDEHG